MNTPHLENNVLQQCSRRTRAAAKQRMSIKADLCRSRFIESHPTIRSGRGDHREGWRRRSIPAPHPCNEPTEHRSKLIAMNSSKSATTGRLAYAHKAGRTHHSCIAVLSPSAPQERTHAGWVMHWHIGAPRSKHNDAPKSRTPAGKHQPSGRRAKSQKQNRRGRETMEKRAAEM